MSHQLTDSVYPQRSLQEVLRWEALQTPLEMAWVGIGLYLVLGETAGTSPPWTYALGQLLLWTAIPFSFVRRYGFYAAR